VAVKNYGNKYDSKHWRHPLTPYRFKDGEAFPYNPSGTRLGYRSWLGLAIHNSNKSGDNIVPATAVTSALIRLDEGEPARLFCFGLEFVNNAKVESWREGRMPLLAIPQSDQEIILPSISLMVGWAEEVNKRLNLRVKLALGLPETPKEVSESFWRITENSFFSTVKDLISSKSREGSFSINENLAKWIAYTHKVNLEIFDSVTLMGEESAIEPKKVFENRKLLFFETMKSGKNAKKFFSFDFASDIGATL